jgi:hypothetical protein
MSFVPIPPTIPGSYQFNTLQVDNINKNFDVITDNVVSNGYTTSKGQQSKS